MLGLEASLDSWYGSNVLVCSVTHFRARFGILKQKTKYIELFLNYFSMDFISGVQHFVFKWIKPQSSKEWGDMVNCKSDSFFTPTTSCIRNRLGAVLPTLCSLCKVGYTELWMASSCAMYVKLLLLKALLLEWNF